MKRMIMSCCFAFLTSAVYSQTQTNQPTSSSTASTSSQTADAVCPDIAEIKKNPTKGNWTAQTTAGFWKSYHFSFATDLKKFIGAQWIGEKVGQITCVYSSEQRFDENNNQKIQQTLPVLLIFHSLTLEPTGVKWKHAGVGVYDCNSFTQSDCGFQVHMKPPVGDIIQEAEALKSKESQKSTVPTN